MNTYVNLSDGIAAALEAQRLAQKYNKDFFDANDLIDVIGVGEANIRKLMSRPDFPATKIGNRVVVSALALAMWIVKQNTLG
ncbi:hypothetical protein FACS1894208_01630 [Clostridia bacterium]|nr:hypothetical protein FACS1894208_01630 [Clostridia bacterium]